ncbi:MAG: nucleotidyltransferase family protein, partial [Candidatus Poribacteria bacterium]
ENIALRPMMDIDLIARSRDIKRIDDILLKLNWNIQEGLSTTGFNEEFSKHISYVTGRVFLEIHPKLNEFPRLDPWANAISANICSNKTFILGKEDFFLHLCIHLEDHYRTGLETNLIWYIDIVKFLQLYQSTINWDYVARVSYKFGYDGIIHSILNEINRSFNITIPDQIINRFNADKSDLSIEKVFNQVDGPIKHFSALIAEITGPRNATLKNRAFIILRNIFPCKAYMMNKYKIRNGHLFYFYYFVRMFKGIRKLISGLYNLPRFLNCGKNEC